MEHYDQAGAAYELEELAIERSLNQFAGVQLAKTTEKSIALNTCEPTRGGEPVAWRLSHVDEETGSLEEVVASVQGVIVQKELPPFERKLRTGASNIRYLKQSVTLSGFNTPTFTSALNEVARLHTLFIRAVGEKNLDSCTIIGQHDGCNTLEVGNRYMTPVKEAPPSQDIPFTPEVDPYGYLATAKGSEYVRLEDNIVLFLERTGSEGAYKFVEAKPIGFQIGDIVEAQLSIIAVPLRDKRFKTMAVLRSLTLFDGSFAQRAAAASQMIRLSFSINPVAPKMMKRKVGYEREVISETRYKLSKMTIDSSNNVREDNEADESVLQSRNTDISVDSLD